MKKTIITILAIFFVCLSSHAFATNYYINGSTGSDTYNGLYETFQGGTDGPWKTLAKAASTVPSGAAHTINVAAGTYSESRVSDSRSGRGEGAERYWLASGEVVLSNGMGILGDYVKFEGFTTSRQGAFNFGSGHNIYVTGDYVILKSNHIHNSTQHGLRVSGNYNTIDNNTLHHYAMWGMDVNGTHHTVTNNDISHAIKPDGQTWYDADAISFFGSYFVFRGNYIHDFLWSDQDAGFAGGLPHMDAFQSYNADTHDIICEQNYIFMGNTTTGELMDVILEPGPDYNGGTGWMLADVDGIIIRNNVVEAHTGIKSGSAGPISNMEVYNNVFRGDQANHYYSPSGIQVSGVTNLDIYNNITVDCYIHYSISGGSGISYDYNLMWDSDEGTPNLTGYTPQAHDQRGVDPVFVTYPPATPIGSSPSNYKIQSSSLAKDAGTTLGSVTDDYARVARPQGSAYDIGAYEYTTLPVQPAPPRELRVIPLN